MSSVWLQPQGLVQSSCEHCKKSSVFEVHSRPDITIGTLDVDKPDVDTPDVDKPEL